MARVVVVRTYQAVEFGKKLETFFSERPSMPKLDIELLQHGISISSDVDSLVIPYSNIAYYKFEKVEPKSGSSDVKENKVRSSKL